MKKILAILMLLVLAFSFAACGESSTPEPTPTPSGGDEPAPEPEKQLIIGFNCNNLTNETMSFMVDVFYKYGEEHNIKILTSQDENDTGRTMNNLENMVAAGADGIIFMNNDPTGMASMVADLKEKGVAIVSYDEYCEYADYSFLCSYYDLGYAIGKMAAEWANENVKTEKIVYGMMGVEVNESATNRSNGIEDGFRDNCPRADIYRVPATMPFVDCFYNMLSARPDIQICASLADGMVVEIAEAWYADLKGAGKDISQYGVFSTDATDIALNLIYTAKKGEGIYRGTIDLGLKDRVPLGMITCCHAAILGKDTPAGYDKINYYEMKLVTEKNIDEYAEFLD
ncbi:MAG: substrate-binding domain-containing protein [Oscillospiraceae bacterium]|nr:substrate-binding domain-containing protein [Oscillospiraceae bacterium]